ncbi:general secretion pathway protein D [Halorhodospira halochloris]|uniref:General secretion pathway protein D n=1 Tax=Halorhodospira halochloris TaxID=1052 RepID=A0A110B1Z4_HALHR|nr:type II secretion system secretin GspD [Halorhodospira halochloris]MBK1652624.1 type II secretion system protein GspD [Halorhodospira halochloris]BAU57925.1 general secretion pathway protein D [Halorhodospira halochloris]
MFSLNNNQNHHNTTYPRVIYAAYVLLSVLALIYTTNLQADKTDGDPWAEGDGGVTLNFEDADIESVVAMVAERTGRNFIVDPRVSGEITIISHHPVDDQQLYQVFLSALQIHGFAAIPVDGAIRIVPKNIAKRDQVPVDEGETAHGEYDFVTRVIEVEHSEAGELVPLLRPLISDEAELAAYQETNTLIISESAGNIERIKRILAQVDRDTSGTTEVIRLDNASASEMVEMVTDIEPEERAGRRLVLTADERSNSVLVAGDPTRRSAVLKLIEELDEQLSEEEGTAVSYLRYADAEEIVPVLEGLAEGMMDGAEEMADISIHAHESTNSLVIDGPPDAVESLRSVVNRLDVRRAQVHVEAIIAEVSADRERELGVQWGALGERGVGVINFGAAGEGSLSNIARAVEEGTPPGVSGITAGAADRGGNLGAMLRVLASHSDTNILSTPSIMTMDNEEAEIVVGQNVPFVTGRAIEESGQAFSSIQREDVGIQLRIVPQINEGDALKLEIEKEISGVEDPPDGAEDLVTSMRSITTTAMVDDGQIIVLGGLIDDQVSAGTQRVPGLSSIPFLGRLFRYEQADQQKQNLMVFIRPRIVENRDDARAVTSPKYTMMRNRQLASQQRGVGYMDGNDVPVLEEAADLMSLPPAYEEQAGVSDHDAGGRIGRPPRPGH